MDLTVVIVNYNVKHYLAQCLSSVFASQGNWEMEVVVVDNNSTDGSIDYLRPLFPQVRYIANKENRGFSKANNQAIREARGRYVLLLNPDTVITEHTLDDCIRHLDRHPEVGGLGVSMYDWRGRFAWESRRGVPTPWTAFCKMVGLTTLFPHSRTFGRYYMRYLNREEANYIEIISGAFNMLRREAIQQVGLLDETFFMYGEDIDLSYRLLLGGWRNAYIPSPILHYKGESTQKSSYRYVRIFHEAMLIFYNKHFSHRHRLLYPFIRAAVHFRTWLGMLPRMARHLRNRLFGKGQPQPETCICVGRPDSLQRMKAICQRNNLQGTFVEGIPTEVGKAMYLVFDTSCFTYDQMLSYLIKGAGKGQEIALGTFHPQLQIMILPHDIYC